jgi:hypothetical protein
MKYFSIPILLLVFYVAHPLHPKCKSNGIWLTGNYKTIPKSGIIILEFMGNSQPVATQLNTRYPIYLLAGKERISLKAIEILKSDYLLTQVVLKPNMAELTPGKTYTLCIDKLKEYDGRPEEYNPAISKWVPIQLTVTNSTYNKKPVFLSLPAETRKTLVQYGCGPAKWVYYQLNTADSSAIFTRAFLKNTSRGITVQFILPVKEGIIRAGHTMCSGAFGFTEGNYYEISFALMDQSGNTGEQTKPIPLIPPVSQTPDE